MMHFGSHARFHALVHKLRLARIAFPTNFLQFALDLLDFLNRLHSIMRIGDVDDAQKTQIKYKVYMIEQEERTKIEATKQRATAFLLGG